jgi:hypothetical protein
LDLKSGRSEVTTHLSAQLGLFTISPHDGTRSQPFKVAGLENEFSKLRSSPLLKLRLPVRESLNLLELCSKIGLT